MRAPRKALFVALVLLVTVLQSPLAIIPHAQSQPDTDTWQIGQASDDCVAQDHVGTAFYLDSLLISGDYSSSYYDYSSGMRFQNISIPQGSTITSAYLVFIAKGLTGVIPQTFFRGQDANDTITFSNLSDYLARERTSSVSYTPSTWVTNNEYNSSNIGSIIQTIIDRPGWVSENSIVIFWRDAEGYDVPSRLIACDYETSAEDCAKLVITWLETPLPSDPVNLFGAGFNASTPYVELYWTHDLVDTDFFEVQNSTDKISWDYLGQNTTAQYTDFQVLNGTQRYYRVRACNYEDAGGWANTTWTDIDFETVYFMPYVEHEADPPVNIPQIDKIEFNTTIAGDRCMVTGAFSDTENLRSRLKL